MSARERKKAVSDGGGARKTRITEGTLQKLSKPDPKGQGGVEIADTILPGFRIRPNKTGYSYVFYARFGGVPSRRTIAPVGHIGLAEARAKAREWLALANEGRDPKAEERAAREALNAQKTFGELMEVFITRHVRKQRKAKDVEREIRRNVLVKLAKRPLAEVTRKEIAALVAEIRDRPAPRHAHNVFGHIRRFYSWLLAQPEYEDLIAASPCDRIRAKDFIGLKNSRQRVLSDQEIAGVWKATGILGYPWGPFYRLLLLTGARKTEASDARWGEFDLTAKLWIIPETRFKSDRKHVIPLSVDAAKLLEELPGWEGGDYVFSTRGGRIPIDGFSKSKAKLDALVAGELGYKPEHWIVHDIRRTVRTQLSKLRVSTEIAELIIGHTRSGLDAVYNVHDALVERAEALDLWAQKLRSIVEPPRDLSANAAEPPPREHRVRTKSGARRARS